MVFRDGRAIIASRQPSAAERDRGGTADSFLSVPIRYSPASGGSRTVGVINLIGRQDGGRFSAANQKLLAAIASQIGAAIENHRLVQESLSKERMAREMELAHDLQMKLLPVAERFEAAEAAARVQPTEQVGGDFYQLFELPGGRVGVMLGDVSLHGFPSALIMTLAMSAAGIYAREAESPAAVLRKLDDALSDELATTEMFLTVFYGVIDPAAGVLVYANAGHPHAFVVREDGSSDRLGATDPPVGFAGPDSYAEGSIAWHESGDLLLLFTDGLSDTLATRGLKNGETQVVETAVQNRFQTAPEIIDALFALTSDAQWSALADDRTALVVRV
jgi:sigma-B regulation protein RsbU (phosphoserine phosphatase)